MATVAQRVYHGMKARGYVFDEGPGELNIVYVEGMNADGSRNANRVTHFDDRRLVLAFQDGQPVVVGNWPATIQAGPKLTNNPIGRAADGRRAAAMIEFGQWRVWTVDIHNGKYEGLCQRAGSLTVVRDVNKNMIRDASDPRHVGSGFGINQHHAYGSAVIGGNSAGCLVTPRVADHQAFMRLVKTDPRYIAKPGRNGFVFRTTVMPYEWLREAPAARPNTVRNTTVVTTTATTSAATGVALWWDTIVAHPYLSVAVGLGAVAAVGYVVERWNRPVQAKPQPVVVVAEVLPDEPAPTPRKRRTPRPAKPRVAKPRKPRKRAAA